MASGTLHAYIDESGDEGFVFPTTPGGAGSSRWFTIAAVVVAAENDADVARSVSRIKTRLWPTQGPQWVKPLHWARLKHAQRRVVVEEIAAEDFILIAVAFDKIHPRLQRERFDSRIVRRISPQLKSTLYYYATRYLTERICKAAKGQGRKVDLIFETRASLSVKELEAYLASLATTRGPYGSPTIPLGVLGRVDAQGKQTCKLLQVVDACAGAVGAALEPNKYGQTDPSYLLDLAPMIHGAETVWGYGLKLFPGDWREYATREKQYAWMKEIGQAPGGSVPRP